MTADIQFYTEVIDAYGFDSNDQFISRMYIYPDTKRSTTYHFKKNELVKELSSCAKNDLYISMNDFTSPARNAENIHQLKHLYVDLDTYHSEYANLPYCNEQILEILQKNYFGKKFPVPNLTVSSGRGLYLIWNINEHKNALPRWKTVQKYLCTLLKDFGADPKVSTDCARVLRVPGSINSKSGKEVKILHTTLEKHTLYEFLDLYMPDSYMKGIRAHEVYRKQNKKNGFTPTSGEENTRNHEVNAKLECKIAKYHSNKTLLEARLSDLENLLLNYRDKEHGSKEYIFFLYRMWALNLYKDTNLVKSMILDLNSRLKHHSDPNRLLQETQSAERYFSDSKIRNMRNETIISFLSISDLEMKNLKTIISKEEAKERKALRNKNAYDAKLERNNNTRKKEKILLRYEKILSYKEEGYTTKEISELLGQSYRQTLRDLQNLENFQNDRTSQYCDNPVNSAPADTITTVLNTEETTTTMHMEQSFLHQYSTQVSFLFLQKETLQLDTFYVTNIQPYLLQDVVLLSATLRILYVSSYLIDGYLDG